MSAISPTLPKSEDTFVRRSPTLFLDRSSSRSPKHDPLPGVSLLLAARSEQAGQPDSDVQATQGIGMRMPGFAQEAPGF